MLRRKGSEAALARLAPLIEGTVSDDRLAGRYREYAVEAEPAREKPAPEMPAAQGGTRQPGPSVNVFKLKLIGVPGRYFWDCRNGPTLLASLALLLPARLVYPLIPTRYGFDRSPGEWFAKKVGVPSADAVLQQRLQAAGLFTELSSLRWGPNPYLPKASFNPRGQAIGEDRLAAYESALKDALGARSESEYESALDDHLRGLAHQHPGKLSLQVEIVNGSVPDQQRFLELLDRAVRIAQINAEANTPAT